MDGAWLVRSGLSVAALLWIVAMAQAGADGPSFECEAAASPVEHLICQDIELMRLDQALAESYAARRARLDREGRERLLAEQRQWLRQRLDRCAIPRRGEPLAMAATWAAAPCLAEQYRARILALGGDPGPAPAAEDAATFIHPLCLEQLVIATVEEGEPAELDLGLCNAGYRHVPVERYDGGVFARGADGSGGRTSFSYRRVGTLPDGRTLALTWSNLGGSGTFSSLALLREGSSPEGHRLLSVTFIPGGGDRCNGGLTDAAVLGDAAITYDSNITSYDLVALVRPDAPFQAYDDLDASAAGCIGTARHRHRLSDGETTLISATVTELADMSWKDEAEQIPQNCFNSVVRSAAPSLPHTWQVEAWRALADRIIDQCAAR